MGRLIVIIREGEGFAEVLWFGHLVLGSVCVV
jgi:hypothetical protein